MPEKMRAMVLSKLGPVESNPLKLTEIDRHEIANPKEILVKIEACGVCHSQLHSIEGDWKDIGIPPTLPTVPGHEVVGKIVEIGSNVTKFKVGERVSLGQEYNGLLAAPAIHSRQSYFLQLVSGKIDQLQSLLPGNDWIELNMRAGRIVERFVELRGQLEEVLELATRRRVKLVPCLRDVWHQHVLFVDDQVSSFVDFGALRIDSVATDVARLLGSVSTVGDDSWLAGLKAYQAVRPLDDDERELIATLELANRAMSGVQWLDWILLENRQFDDPEAVIKRLDDLICGPPEDPKS